MAHGFIVDSSDVERSLNCAQTPKYSEHPRRRAARHSEGAIPLIIPPPPKPRTRALYELRKNEAEQAGLFVAC